MLRRKMVLVLSTLLPVKSPDSMPDADISFWKADPTRILALNAEIVNLANFEQIPLVDMFAAFGVSLNSTVDCSNSSSCRNLLSVDGLHPTPSGYQRMAQALFNQIVSAFEVR